jgi:hypothetical protein
MERDLSFAKVAVDQFKVCFPPLYPRNCHASPAAPDKLYILSRLQSLAKYIRLILMMPLACYRL